MKLNTNFLIKASPGVLQVLFHEMTEIIKKAEEATEKAEKTKLLYINIEEARRASLSRNNLPPTVMKYSYPFYEALMKYTMYLSILLIVLATLYIYVKSTITPLEIMKVVRFIIVVAFMPILSSQKINYLI